MTKRSIVTKAELADRLEVSRPRVTQYTKAGLPVRADGRINLIPALDWVVRNIEPGGSDGGAAVRAAALLESRSGRAGGGDSRGGDGADLTRERVRLTKERAALLRLQREEREGGLLPAAEVADAWEQVANLIRTNFLGLPAKISPQLVGRSAIDIQAQLTREVRAVLSMLANPVVQRTGPPKVESDAA